MTEYNYTEPKFENIPIELRSIPRWVTWKAEGAPGEKPRKIPYAPDCPNTKASSTDPYTWGTFDQAESSFYDGDRTGIGFVLNNDGIVGVDIDHCINAGEVSQDALRVLEWLGASYVEVSPSGTGLRAFGYAPPLERGCKGKIHGLDVELYSTGRYLTLTGQVVKQSGSLSKLDHFEQLAQELRGAGREVINPETGEVERSKPHDRHAELIRMVLTGEVLHDSLRDLAASLISNGMRAGAAVSQLRALMKAGGGNQDDRWRARYNQIPALVRSAEEKFKPEPEIDLMMDNISGDEITKLLDVVWASDLPEEYTSPDELVQGVVTCGSSSVVYGDSNSGKTFFVLDMCCAVARGVEWMGRKTEPGLVVYLATEAPSSIMSRVQAYQRHHGCIVENLAIVRVPLNFYESSGDAANVIRLIQHVEKERGIKARLIVGDTLARMSAGANENSGEDMGPVMARFERVSKETGAHMMTIHHNGKDAAKGSRGWSGIRAHIDTEIELEDKKDTRVATITKQRELPGKGTEIFFKLEIVVMGKTKWGEDATTCVVVQDDSDRQEYVSKESDSLAGYRRHFENAVRGFGRFDTRLDRFFVNTEAWADYSKKHAHASEQARRTYLSKAKKELVRAGYIEEVHNGYAATDHEALSGAFTGLPKY
jgi:KaiC/GvpD/RAD55 family RecA-like ATPase